MADTPRTLADLQTLLADNTTGAVSPADVRDFLVSVMGRTKSIWLPATAFVVGTGADQAIRGSSANAYEKANAWAFDKDATEYITTTLLMPTNWDGGTVVFSFYWAPSSTNTGKVAWRIDVTGIASGEQIDQVSETSGSISQAANGTTDALHIAATGAVQPPAGLLRLLPSRQATDAVNDTYTADAWLLGVLIEYTAVF